jgi:hypothetical protein
MRRAAIGSPPFTGMQRDLTIDWIIMALHELQDASHVDTPEGFQPLLDISDFITTLLNDANAQEARDTLGVRLTGALFGLTLSNNAGDATNDIDAAGGWCRDGTDVDNIVIPAAMGKRLDALWLAGGTPGATVAGLDAGAVANGTYHVFALGNPTTGAGDILFSTSPTAPDMTRPNASGFTLFRRIGSILREAGAIVAFWQNGDYFKRVLVVDRNSTAAAAAALLALSVPDGIVVSPIITVIVLSAASVTCAVTVGSAAEGVASARVANGFTGAGDSTDSSVGAVGPGVLFTNTARQIMFQQVNSVGTPTSSILNTVGWMDFRGRVA